MREEITAEDILFIIGMGLLGFGLGFHLWEFLYISIPFFILVLISLIIRSEE